MSDITANWGWPQWIVITLWALRLMIEAVKHGEQRTGKYNLAASFIGAAVIAVILWKGGFFR